MSVFVLVDAWQQQCCGVDFQVGSKVQWHVQAPDAGADWVGELLGADWGRKVRCHEEHHGTGGETVELSGSVVSIRVLTSDVEPIEGADRGFRATPGTGRLAPTNVIDKWGPERQYRPDVPPTTQFVGWLVEVDAADPGRG